MGRRRDYEILINVDDSQVIRAMENIEDAIDDMAKEASKDFERLIDSLDDISGHARRSADTLELMDKQGGRGFNNVGRSARASGVRIGAVAGIVASLTSKLIDLGQEGVRAFSELIKESVRAAQVLETTGASLVGIFEGNEEAALAALGRIREESIRLGVDISELAPAFLPRLENLDQFARVAELAAGLARIDPAQGAPGARIALQEALSGELLTLRRRFEIDIRPIQQAQEELGEMEGLLVGLQNVLAARGQDFETLGDTAAFTFGQTRTLAEDAQKTFGEPILDALKEDFQALNDFILENKDSIDIIAGALGDVIADIADLTGDQLLGFVEDLDFDAIQQIILDIQDLIDIIEALRQVNEINPFRQLSDGIGETLPDLFDLETAMKAVIQLMGLINAAAAAGIEAVTGYFEIVGGIASGDISFGQLSEEWDRLGESVRGAARDELSEASSIIEDLNTRLEENEQRLRDRIQAQKEDSEEGLAAADSILAQKQALEEEAKAAEEAAEAQEKINEAREKFDIGKERAEFDLLLDQQRKALDAEIEFAQKREDIARKNEQAIADIRRKNAQRIIDAATDLQRDEEDIARDQARRIEDLEEESAKKRTEIETNYRRELERIRFAFDAQEAIRANDTIAFLRIQRRKDFELEQAKQQREEEVQDAEQSAVERREELQKQLEREIEDARIANQRKLEDLRIALQRDFEEQQINYQSEIEQQQIAEQRKREELQRSFQQQREDFNRHWERKLQDLQRNLQKELEIIRQFEQRKAAIQRSRRVEAGRQTADEALRQRALNVAKSKGRDDLISRIQDASRDELTEILKQLIGDRGRIGGRQFGGYTPAGIDFLVGERGPEVLRLPVAGEIIPNYRLKFNPATAGLSRQTTVNNRTTNLNLDAMLDTLSPQQIAIVQQLVRQLQLSVQ